VAAPQSASGGFADGELEVVAGAELAVEEIADHGDTGASSGFAVLGFQMVTTSTTHLGFGGLARHGFESLLIEMRGRGRGLLAG
jgi:hypothetical protein